MRPPKGCSGDPELDKCVCQLAVLEIRDSKQKPLIGGSGGESAKQICKSEEKQLILDIIIA